MLGRLLLLHDDYGVELHQVDEIRREVGTPTRRYQLTLSFSMSLFLVGIVGINSWNLVDKSLNLRSYGSSNQFPCSNFYLIKSQCKDKKKEKVRNKMGN